LQIPTETVSSNRPQGGVLFCAGGLVSLRRHDSGRVTVEGCLCDEFYQVRDLLYEQYAIV
jgi:cleavage and polyadenylation specificity factor subunit 2